MNIEKNVTEVREKIRKIDKKKQPVNIIAATKYVDIEQINSLYHSGIKKMGENRVDALLSKKKLIDLPIEWHFIGTLQSRKVKDVINEIDCLHSLDRESLAKEIDKHRKLPLKCFVQVNISGEETKQGLKPDEVASFITNLKKFSKIEVIGLMTMAPHTDDIQKIRSCFQQLRLLQGKLLKEEMQCSTCKELSMGMSNDYLIAIEEGATYVRLGSVLFKD